MRIIKEINIDQIIVDKHSVSKETLNIVDFIRKGGKLPPIKVQKIKGQYKLKDGRHRITAYKLLGCKKIECKFFEE